MKYFLIAGEASGDLHAAHLMKALRHFDAQAEFRFFGGDAMQQQGGTLLCHYRHLAYMGFIPVLLHLRTILRGLAQCKEAILAWRPDVVILVDYPGFNLKIARFVRQQAICPVFYYISPKIWAWKEHRIKALRRDVDRIFSILPFEVPYFRQRHGYEVSYVGNPTLDEVHAYCQEHGAPTPDDRTLALLPGSRKQEINDNLSRMLTAAAPLVEAEGWKLVIAAAPAIPRELYLNIIARAEVPLQSVELVDGNTYGLLSRATAALVTSGTATLETALFRVPQVVCYYMAMGRLVSLLRRLILRTPYISLVNLVANREVVQELVADGMTPERVRTALRAILPGQPARQTMLEGYDEVRRNLGDPGAPMHAAAEMVERLRAAHAEPSRP